MILTSVTLEDYGAYGGTSMFDLSCQSGKPIVLIGGTNGAGKTTLFGAIPLCLYGIASVGKCTVRQYRNDLARKIHRGVSAGHAAITVQFTLMHNGRKTEYKVRRSWGLDGKESLDIGVRGPNDTAFVSSGVEPSSRQSYIDKTVPVGIMDLFFIDGERISSMARNGMSNTVSNAIRHLGMDTVENLRADLRAIVAGHSTNSGLKKEYEKCSADGKTLDERMRALSEDIAKNISDGEDTEVKIESLTSKISNGRYERIRASLLARKEEHERLSTAMRETCSGPFPFSLIPNEMKALSDCLASDDEIRQKEAGRRLLKSALSALSTDGSWEKASIDPKAAVPVISEVLNGMISDADTPPKIDLSTGQVRHINNIALAAGDLARDINDRADKLDAIQTEIDTLESALVDVPDDTKLGRMAAALGILYRHAGELAATREHMNNEAATCAFHKKRQESKMYDIMSKMYGGVDSQRAAALAGSVLEMLDAFAQDLKSSRLSLIQQRLMEAIKTLLRKKELIDDVLLNPDTLAVELYRHGSRLPAATLSEGERHLLAICTLWAIAKSSRMSLPIVMDTPLARLDGQHRKNVLERFLPCASPQCVVLSTDREIGHEEYGMLEPHIARSYTIDHSESTGAATIRDGYQWRKECQS